MQQLVLFLLLAIAAGITLVMLFAGLYAFFGNFLRGVKVALDANPGRSVLIGLVNALFLLAIGYLFIAWAQSTGIAVLGLVGGLLWLGLTLGLVFGLTGVVLSARDRFNPETDNWRSIASAGGILVLASLTPYIGWFGFFPYLLLRGLGGVVIHLQTAYRDRKNRAD